MLEESEKTGPRIRRSRGGRPARRMMEPLSRWRVSETPHRSSRIQRRAPAFFFPTLPAPAGDTARGGDGGAGCDADGGGGDGDGEGGADEYFIDRDPECFAVLLDLLRTGGLHVPPHVADGVLCREALYYGLLDRVRAARWGPFDGDRLRLAASVAGKKKYHIQS